MISYDEGKALLTLEQRSGFMSALPLSYQSILASSQANRLQPLPPCIHLHFVFLLITEKKKKYSPKSLYPKQTALQKSRWQMSTATEQFSHDESI